MQAGGVRAEGAVGEEVARGADGAQFPCLRHALVGPLGPVPDDAGAGHLAGQLQQAGEVVLGGDLWPAALVHRTDAEGGRVGEGGALGFRALGGGDGGERGRAYRVMGVPGERRVLARDVAADQVEQGGGDDRRVHVDAGEVQGAATGGLVEFGTRGRAATGPAGGVPAVAQQDAVVRAGCGEVADQGEGCRQGGRAGEVESGQGEPRGGGVHMGVGEGGGDEGAVEVDHLVHAVGEGVGRALGADPGDLAALHHHRGREGVGGAVHLAAAEEDGPGGLGVGGAVAHSGQFLLPAAGCGTWGGSARSRRARPPVPPRGVTARGGKGGRGAPLHTRGGRASYGVDSTTVVRVETPARERSLASSSSSSCGVATRTLRM